MKQLLTLGLILTIGLNGIGQDGALDNDFDTDGVKEIHPGTWSDSEMIMASTVQDDGKILLSGGVGDTDWDCFVLRMYPDGTMDNTFGTSGVVRIDVGGESQMFFTIDELSDGSLVMVGAHEDASTSGLIIVKLLPDGSFDNSFDTDGILTVVSGSSIDVVDAEITDNNKINILGNYGGYLLSMQYNMDGTIDSLYGSSGMILHQLTGSTLTGTSLNIQDDGKLVITGKSEVTAGDQFMTARLNPDGYLDYSFSYDGFAIHTVTSATPYRLYDCTILPDGKIVAVGHIISGGNNIFLIKYESDGSLDLSFGNNGYRIIDVTSSYNYGTLITAQPDGKLLICGPAGNTDLKPAVTRVMPDGAIDSTFGSNGSVIIPYIPLDYDRPQTMTLTDGKLLVAGHSELSGSSITWGFAFRILLGYSLDVAEEARQIGGTKVYPNPVESSFQIGFDLSNDTNLSIELYNSSFQRVAILSDEENFQAGSHERMLQFPDELSSGVYFLRLQGKSVNKVVKVVKD